MRPRKYYVHFSHDTTTIIEGCAAARRVHAAGHGFRTRLEAEEWAAWWRYDHALWFERPSTTDRASAAFPTHHPL